MPKRKHKRKKGIKGLPKKLASKTKRSLYVYNPKVKAYFKFTRINGAYRIVGKAMPHAIRKKIKMGMLKPVRR
ncbi:MAG: hypothetical protein DRJ69_04650 [Thermoprotei archaeon]|nr:MAG: hypothetical protein DRJ69_04650 [Thermoprotei archaeon]